MSIFTKDYVDILEAITESGFYTEDPEEACIFVPPFNLLNEAILDPISSSKGWWKFLFLKTLLGIYFLENDYEFPKKNFQLELTLTLPKGRNNF